MTLDGDGGFKDGRSDIKEVGGKHSGTEKIQGVGRGLELLGKKGESQRHTTVRPAEMATRLGFDLACQGRWRSHHFGFRGFQKPGGLSPEFLSI